MSILATTHPPSTYEHFIHMAYLVSCNWELEIRAEITMAGILGTQSTWAQRGSGRVSNAQISPGVSGNDRRLRLE